MKNVIVIGGGIIGVCSAYFLQKSGHQVTLVDQSDMNHGASYINAGYVCPSHLTPLAAPGVLKQGVRWMLNQKSPLYVKPRLNADFLKWSRAFYSSCSAKNVTKGIPAIKSIALLGKELYTEIKEEEKLSFDIENKGLLMICQTEKMLEEEIEIAHMAEKEGLSIEVLSPNDISNKQPNTTIKAKGAVLYLGDQHMIPSQFMNEIKGNLQKSGVQFLLNEKVEDISVSDAKIVDIQTTQQVLKAEEYVFAAGAWTPSLSKKTGVSLLVQAGKGYSINTDQDIGITIPSILCESKIAVTPMKNFTRFAGTMEIAGINQTINTARVEAIAMASKRYFTDLQLSPKEKKEASCGLRPVSPDGLPYIGKSKKCKNLTIATGHAMMGWTMGPSTGKLVAELISGKKPSIPIDAFHPDRRF